MTYGWNTFEQAAYERRQRLEAIEAKLTRYTVFTFDKDLSFMGDNYRDRKPGVHYIFGKFSDGGYTFEAWNTLRGRWQPFMREGYILENIRVIGQIPESPDCDCDCRSEGEPVTVPR